MFFLCRDTVSFFNCQKGKRFLGCDSPKVRLDLACGLIVVGMYVPNSGQKLARLDYRVQETWQQNDLLDVVYNMFVRLGRCRNTVWSLTLTRCQTKHTLLIRYYSLL